MTSGAARRTVRDVAAADHIAPGFTPSTRARLVGGAVFAAVVQVAITLVVSGHQPESRSMDVFAVALLLIGPAGLLLRYRSPALGYVLAFVPTMTYVLLDYPMGPVFTALLIAYVNAAMRGHRRLAWTGLAVGYVLSAWVAPWLADDEPWPLWGAAIGLAAWLLVLAVGTELAQSWLDRAAERAQARAEEERRLAGEERLRIARELHDVLAHDISLISVRAGVALHLVDTQPERLDVEQVRSALAAIKDASKDALGELRSVLDVLRNGDREAAPLAPTAGLSDLDALVERARGTGLDVDVERPDDLATDLPAGVSLAAFRIVQEALTNVVRHAAARHATVRLRRSDDVLEVQVDDDGAGLGAGTGAGLGAGTGLGAGGGGGTGVGAGTEHAGRAGTGADADRAAGTAVVRVDSPGGGGGRGIAGMRERAHALGGTLEAGPRPGKGFRVRARFPVRDDERDQRGESRDDQRDDAGDGVGDQLDDGRGVPRDHGRDDHPDDRPHGRREDGRGDRRNHARDDELDHGRGDA